MDIGQNLLRKLLDNDCQPCAIIGYLRNDAFFGVDALFLDSGISYEDASRMIPHGLSMCGVWASSEQALITALSHSFIVDMMNDKPGDSSITLAYPDSATLDGPPAAVNITVQRVKSKIATNSKLSSLGTEVAVKLINSEDPKLPNLEWLTNYDVHIIRCFVDLELRVKRRDDSLFWASLNAAFLPLVEELRKPEVAFLLSSITSSGEQRIATVGASEPESAASLTGLTSSPESPITARVLMIPHLGHDASPSSWPAPSFVYEVADSSQGDRVEDLITCPLHVEGVAYIPAGCMVAEALVTTLLSRLEAIKAVMLRQGSVVQVTSHHFLPPGRAHHITIDYPRIKADLESNELILQPYRRQLHTLLGLPMDRPALRVLAAFSLPTSVADKAFSSQQQIQEDRLKDVHMGLPLPGPSEFVHLIHGSYDYHHYMQDRFDDSGWGCAYRSLQTICSWFRLQQYASKPSPNHREIQEILVKLGDKEKSFVGSTKWIGAIELSYVLDEYLGVTSKIITINRGSDIPQHARELAAHFKSQGTPIMIGGGVLAYTLLGVYFNDSTGDCAFLILDPHYTGAEVLPRIHKGTWVAWKRLGDTAAAGGPLFVQDAFYNFLCPQRPKQV
ncbi:hypothetical protein CEUSTIGMA_g7345.t1 [Chlamydomonas eustigma]|uniref:Ufm1-specific protease n=1 Tax=Chlamydomonas eustigma TaxID=1157962 RepID=A0A250X9X6_9CHLO|nr:hypothetical protein CEUSTIGMA_g7345.t1 [Chlamydomonas eustigma]|eukprot:GAX79905.1 hypothetical protein CEUSTIGMA_g7345.t1 [Chlamydomonas eustigma]